MYPTYNSGKVLGKINWLLEKSSKTKETLTSSQYEEIAEIVIPINRKDLNEFVFGHCKTTNSSANLTLKYSSETQNDMFENIVYFLRNASIGDRIYVKNRGSSVFETDFFINIISETENEFIIKIAIYGSSSSSYMQYYKIAVGYR